MRLLVAALIAFAPAAAISASLPDRSPKPFAKPANCPQTAHYFAWHRDKSVKLRKLTELPDANAYAAVSRRVRGCEAPVVVKYGVSKR